MSLRQRCVLKHSLHYLSICCCCSVIQLCLTFWDPMNCSTPGLPVPHHLPEFAQVHIHCIGDAIQPTNFLMPSSPSAFNLSQHQGLFQWVSSSHQIAKILELLLQNQSFFVNYLGLISLKIDWFDLLAVQRTFKCLLQHHSLKASVLGSTFFIVQLSQPYMNTGKTIALTIWTFDGRVLSLLFNTLSRLVIAFLPRSNHLLILWVQSPSTVILRPKKRKSVTTSTFSFLFLMQ